MPAPDLHAGTLQERRHILGHGCGDEHLLAVDDVGGQAPAPPGVELGEDIVEHEDRVVVEVAPQEPEGREPQREGERPRLPVRGIALRRQRPEREEQVVAVQADEADAALDLLTAHLREPIEEGLAQLRRLGHLAVRERLGRLLAQARAIGRARVGVRVAHRVVGGGQQRPQVPQEPQPGVEQLRSHRREMLVPHLERVQRRAGLRLGVDPDIDSRARAAIRAPAGPERAGRRLQERVALPDDLVVVRAHPGPARLPGDEEVVDEATPLLGVTLDEREILRREEHRPHRAEHVARAGDG